MIVNRTVVVHCFDGVFYVAINGGPMVAATPEEVRAYLDL